jgi:hypothetical protein
MLFITRLQAYSVNAIMDHHDAVVGPPIGVFQVLIR